MQVLAIGNSFSQDASAYLHKIAQSAGKPIDIVNLYIPGCPLERHFRNMMSDSKSYELEVNGTYTGFAVTMKEALLNRRWDVVTIQQASHMSTKWDSYSPYISPLAGYIRKLSPASRLAVHQTWAYEEGSERLCGLMGYETQQQMFEALESCYRRAADEISADLIIPSGAAFRELVKEGIAPVYRDTFHASLVIGRYTLGLVWYQALTGGDVSEAGFDFLAEPVGAETIKAIKEYVKRVGK
ncbi:MAG: DUF4886 domain-containing protein [Clostridiales bacterium]|jgi:hypothetical protein|nr:DUF4886 domain-containing protein [Clostridiales bacterium]